MKNIGKTFLIFLFGLSMTQSCTNLDEEVFSQLTSDNFPQTEDQFISALGATYSSLSGLGGHNGYNSMQMVAGDAVMIPQRGNDWFDGGVWLRSHRHEYNSQEGWLNNAWGELYGGVNNCNRVIELFESLVADGSVAQADADAFISELRTLRAYFYFLLLDAYGNVPLVTAFSGGEANPSTSSRSEVFAFIESELNASVPNLSRAKDGTTYGRFNYYSGKALQSRLYLNAEVYTGTQRNNDAIAAADEVINSGLYSLEGDYFANFNVNNEGSNENIFVVPYDNTQNCCFFWAQMTNHYSSQTVFNLNDQPWNGYCALEEFYNSYDDTDARKGEWGNPTASGNFIAGPMGVTDPGVEPNDPDGPGIVHTPEINAHFPNALRQAGVRIGKYEFAGGPNTMSNDFVLFRYAEVLLNKAEAQWRNGQGDAGLPMVNMIRERAGLAGFTTLTPEDLLAERGRELFVEGVRRTDLIRFGAYGEEWDFKPTSDASREIFPIPQAQLDANPNLQQNPGY